METTTTGQVSKSAADIYDEFFVPALFAEWAPRVVDAAGIVAGNKVLDVACGTGVLTREALRRVGSTGKATGLDRNDGMLAVARRNAPGIEWREGRAEALPFDDGAFDAVVCQFGLMFFEDRVKALVEMRRVLRPGGRLAVAVWHNLGNSPGYAAVTSLLQRLFGNKMADAMRAPFVLGDTDELARLFTNAGMNDALIATVTGTARFSSIEAWVHTDIKGWTLADMINDDDYRRLLDAARTDLKKFATSGGSVEFASPAHIVTSTRT